MPALVSYCILCGQWWWAANLAGAARLAGFTCQLVSVLGGSIVPEKCWMQVRLCSQPPARISTSLSRVATSNAPSAKLGLPYAKAQLPKHDIAASTCLASYCSWTSGHLKLRCAPHSKDVQLGRFNFITQCNLRIRDLGSLQNRDYAPLARWSNTPTKPLRPVAQLNVFVAGAGRYPLSRAGSATRSRCNHAELVTGRFCVGCTVCPSALHLLH